MYLSTDIVERLKHSDADAQAEFWTIQFEETHRICAHILGMTAGAADVATDVLTDFMFNHVHSLSEVKAAKSYLRLMAVRRSLRIKKKQMGEIPVESRLDLATDEDGPEIQAAHRQMLPILEKCLEILTPKAQAVIRLRYTQAMANEKIGQTVGGSKQYIGRLITKSLALLQQCMEKGAPAQ